MGLFGDKDIKIIKTEVTGLRLAISMRHRARDPRHFENGVVSAVSDAAMAARRLQDQGRRDEVLSLLDRLTAESKMQGDAQQFFLNMVGEIRGALDRPASDFELS